MTIRDVGAALRRFWPLAVGVFALFFVAGALAAFLPADRYRSTATMLLQPKSAQAASFALSEAVQFLVPPVIEKVGSDEFEQQVRTELGSPDASLHLSAESEPGTGVLFVRAESTDSGITQEAAGRAADIVEEDPPSDLINASILSPATAPEKVSTSRRAVILFGSAALGLIAGLFAALAAQALRPRPSDAADVKQRFGIEVIGQIPYRRRLPATTAQLSNGGGPQEVFEAFQKLAVNLEILTPPNSTLAVTSWAQGEGKTVITSQLASALASLRHDVTIVDCDLRRPSLHEALGVSLTPGVAEIAAGGRIEAARQRTTLSNLDVIAAGAAGAHHPAKMIAEALPRLLAGLDDRIVLLDTPPLFGAETSIIATRVDSVILVVDARRTQPLELRNALGDLELSNARVLGAVLNRAPRTAKRRGSDYYYRARPLSRASL